MQRLADEPAVLLRLATLVAEGVPASKIFAAVSDEVERLLGSSAVVARFENDGMEIVSVGVSAGADIPVGTRWPFEAGMPFAQVYRTRRSAGLDAFDWTSAWGVAAETARRLGIVSAVSSPILVGDRLWGAVTVFSTKDRLPADTEDRLEKFAQLVATAIANAEARDRVSALVDEQAALRRVAALVAQDAAPAEIFAAVSVEVDRLFLDEDASGVAGVVRFDRGLEHVVVGVSRTVEVVPLGSRWKPDNLFAPTLVLRTGRSARVDEGDLAVGGSPAEFLRGDGYLSQAASPIFVGGRPWGAISINSRQVLPADAAERLEKFTELVATAIANAESRAALAELAGEQAALRRVATLLARGVSPTEVFAAVAAEVGRLLDVSRAYVTRYESGKDGTLVAGWSATATEVPVGLRFEVADGGVAAQVRRTGLPARVDAYAPGPAADTAKVMGIESAVAAPISVEGSLWGLVLVGSTAAAPPPPGTEQRLAGFTELVATAIGNAQAREELRQVADEQAALRRVATLVAEGAAPAELFAAVADEVAAVLGVSSASVSRFLPDGHSVVLASLNDPGFPVGSRWWPDKGTLNAAILGTGRPVRIDQSAMSGPIAEASRVSDVRSVVGVPIVVDGSAWGMVAVGRQHSDEPLPADTEVRLSDFTELVATAISNAEARDSERRLADEQAALRRVATLVARDAPSAEVFKAVALEVGRLLDTDMTVVGRYDDDEAATAIGSWSASGESVPVGTRSTIGGHNILTIVSETGKPARMDGYDDASGDAADIALRYGWRSSIAAPIVVEGRVWGVILVATRGLTPFPARAEERLAAFTDLIATAIANAEGKSELAASRRRIVTAADEARRRIERDLHDGIQQRLIALRFDVQRLGGDVSEQDTTTGAGLERLDVELESVLEELREVSRGIHPPLLSRGGLLAPLRTLARRSPIPVELRVVTEPRPPEAVEVAAYYAISEALTNAIKYSQASSISIAVEVSGDTLRIVVRDDGVGGASPGRGSGLTGLIDRVGALDGKLDLESPDGEGTMIEIQLPVHTPVG